MLFLMEISIHAHFFTLAVTSKLVNQWCFSMEVSIHAHFYTLTSQMDQLINAVFQWKFLPIHSFTHWLPQSDWLINTNSLLSGAFLLFLHHIYVFKSAVCAEQKCCSNWCFHRNILVLIIHSIERNSQIKMHCPLNEFFPRHFFYIFVSCNTAMALKESTIETNKILKMTLTFKQCMFIMLVPSIKLLFYLV